MGRQTEAERLAAVFAQRRAELDPVNRFSYAKMDEMLTKYQLDDKYLVSEEVLREVVMFARHGAMLDERDRCVRVCEWHGENAFSKGASDIYYALADDLENPYEP